MSLLERTASSLAPQNCLGAREITSFDGTPANDNVSSASRPLRARTTVRWWMLPALAFTGGMTAALIATGVTEWLSLGG